VTGNDIGLALYDRRLAGDLSGIEDNRENRRVLRSSPEGAP